MALDLRRKLFARYYDRMAQVYEREVAPDKAALLRDLAGTVLEIGPGTGANLEHLPAGVSWIGIEPNEHMHPLLRAKAEALGLAVDLRRLGAEGLPAEAGSVDAVLSTLVLCSVPDPAGVLAEIRRVLRPGGRFVFWEHVGAAPGSGLRALQHALTPFQRFFADGCRANRDLGADIRAAGFADVQLEEFRVPKGVAPPWIRPHVRGFATR
jgi:SAM-dependent methyltransferase